MSHFATNWALQRRGLRPTSKIVLWHLCDRFNPDYGCFPSQNRLAYDSEISRSTLNDHLAHLEAAGLLRRVPRLDPTTKRQLPTHYILAFEPGFTPADVVPCPEIGHGVEATAETADCTGTCDRDDRPGMEPCPDFALSRVREGWAGAELWLGRDATAASAGGAMANAGGRRSRLPAARASAASAWQSTSPNWRGRV